MTFTIENAPKQARSRAAWARILDASVAILSERGIPALTVSAVCDAAGVSPSAIYARVADKRELFLAAYDHAMVAIRADESALEGRTAGQSDSQAAERAVCAIAGIFQRHAGFLKHVITTVTTDPVVQSRGAAHSDRLREAFIDALVGSTATASSRARASGAFSIVFSSLIVGVAFGRPFGALPLDEGAPDLLTGVVAGIISTPPAGS